MSSTSNTGNGKITVPELLQRKSQTADLSSKSQENCLPDGVRLSDGAFA